MASLHKNGFASKIHQHFPDLNLTPMASIASDLYRLEVGNKLPTSPQYLASKKAQDPPKMD
jgi:hypothetical protein